jgi:hypothetical protein
MFPRYFASHFNIEMYYESRIDTGYSEHCKNWILGSVVSHDHLKTPFMRQAYKSDVSLM